MDNKVYVIKNTQTGNFQSSPINSQPGVDYIENLQDAIRKINGKPAHVRNRYKIEVLTDFIRESTEPLSEKEQEIVDNNIEKE